MKSKTTAIVTTILFLLIILNDSFPQVMQLDTSFGHNGIVTTSLNVIGSSGIRSSAIQRDGKIVVAGYTRFDDQSDFALARYNPDGSLDIDFGIDGIVITSIGTFNDEAYSVAIQPNGKILAGGYTDDGSQSDFALVLYNPDGSLDIDFGTNGVVTTEIGSANDFIRSLAIQSDGKIIAAGNTFNGTNYDFCLARYNTDGNLDTTFDADGVVIIYGETSQDMINSVAIQTDGKIITAGYSDARGDNDFAILRYNTNGTPDNTFGLSGIVFTGDRSSQEEARSVIIQSDEKIVAVGYSQNGITTDFVLTRYKTNGTPDSTFGINGIVKTLDLGNKGFYSTVIQSSDTGNGKIIVGGCTNFYGTYDFTLARYNPDGTLDNSFGKDGTTITVISSSNDIANSIILKPADNGENKIIVGGISSQSGVEDFSLAQYNFNGTIDSTFGEDGIVTTTVGRSQNKAFSTVIQNDGKIVVAGTTINETNYDAAVIRYTPDGDLDNTFGVNGSVTAGGSGDECIYSAAIQRAGSGGEKIIVGGFSSESGTKDFVLARFNLDGTLDTTFGNGGTAVTPIGSAHDEINSITVQENGKIIAAGYTDNGSDKDFAIARYMPDGELDSTFGGAGYVTTPIGTKDERANSVVIESAGMGDAKIIAVGYAAVSDHDFAVVRYKPNGELDDSFGDGGIVTTKIGAVIDEANSVAIQSDGKIIAAGFTTSEADGKKYFALVRYNTDGNLDSSFRNNGIIITKPGASSNGVIQSVSIQSNGKIIVAGYCIQLGMSYDFALARYNPDGELDNTFGTYGIVTTSIGTAYATSHAYSSVIQSDGKIVTAGYTQNPYRNYCSFALARYKGDPVTDVDEKKNNIQLSSFFLKQNYPNPFNPSTTLSFAIAHRSFVSLKVYDILGREVATLVNEEKQPGTYEVRFDTRETTNNKQLSSGIYFYQLQAGEFTETKKMILLR